MKSKSEFIVKNHRCRKPKNWFWLRFTKGTEWKCKCGRQWRYIFKQTDLIHTWKEIL